jgi:hypothetical protein
MTLMAQRCVRGTAPLKRDWIRADNGLREGGICPQRLRRSGHGWAEAAIRNEILVVIDKGGWWHGPADRSLDEIYRVGRNDRRHPEICVNSEPLPQKSSLPQHEILAMSLTTKMIT